MKNHLLIVTLSLTLLAGILVPLDATAQFRGRGQERDKYPDWNNKIRQEKFDLIVPQSMRARGVDMWIHVMRQAVPDSFGAQDLGSTSGLFVFTDRGGDRIERAVLGRRWGATQRQRGGGGRNIVEESDAYDIIAPAVFVGEPVSSPMTEYDYRFKGLREFVDVRDPKVIAVNFRQNLATWPTSSRTEDGLSHIDYLLLEEELGEKYASRIVSSEYLIMDYGVSPVPSEVALLKQMRDDELERVEQALAAIKPGVTPTNDAGLTVLRRMRTGQSQRGRSAGWEGAVVQGGDMLAAPSQGLFAYVLRDGETKAPEDIQNLWAEYLKIDKILVETIKAGRTSREIMSDYEQRFEEAGIILRPPQLHMTQPKNDFPAYAIGYDPGKTHLSIDLHGKGKGSQPGKFDIYMGPRMGSYGPDWTYDIPLAMNHHFVLEYFFYMPSPGPEGMDQYLLFWNHEQAVATKSGVEYLSIPQKEVRLIK